MNGEMTSWLERMRRSRSGLDAFVSDESGATAIEYSLIVALIFLAIVAAVTSYSQSTSDMYGTIEDALVE